MESMWPSAGVKGGELDDDLPLANLMKIPWATNREGGLRRAVVFVAAVGLILLYSLRGGSYDIVVRESQGVVLWAGISLALLTGVVRRISVTRAGLCVAGSLLLLAAWSGAGLSWTESNERGLAEMVRCLDYLGVVTLVLLVLDRDTWRAAAAGVSTAILAVCSLALLSRLAPASFPENLIREAFASPRLGYPFAYWNALAAWCAMGIAVALAWSVDAQRGAIRALAGAVMPICGLVLYLTYSRAGLEARDSPWCSWSRSAGEGERP